MIHNTGLVINTFNDLKAFFLDPSPEREDNSIQEPGSAGYGTGRIIFYLLSDNELAKQVDPAEGMDFYWFG